MDARNFESGAIATAPTKPITPSVGYATNGNGSTVPPTVPGAYYFHKIAQEMNNVITGAGLTPNDDELDQFWQAIQSLLIPIETGTIIDFPAATPPNGFLIVPISPTNISRTVYANLYQRLDTTWGAGDGSTTFGMPWFPADYASIQANGNVATQTVGENLTHFHNLSGYHQLGFVAGNRTGLVYEGGTVAATASGGAANLPAGVRMLKCIKY